MKEKIWIKSVLEAYKFIGKVTKTIDKMVINNGVKSHMTYGFVETVDIASKMIELVNRKRKLCLLKNLTEDALKSMTEESAKVLVLYFIDNFDEKTTAKLLNVSRRTFQRILSRAIGECYLQFLKEGYSYQWMKEEFKSERWLFGIYDTNISKSRNIFKTRKVIHDLPMSLILCN